jgi:3-oxoacyl-[acyl-carrier protein] reductase
MKAASGVLDLTFALPEDLAPMALAVLSNRISAYVTGAAFTVDGGLALTNWFEPPELGEV